MTLNATKKPPVKANGGWSQAKIDIYWFGRILWACRISAASAFGGLALFWGVVQAQNLFADRSFDELFFGAHYWLLVFAAEFLIWAFPIHYGARRILDDSDGAWMLSLSSRLSRSPITRHAL